MENEFFNQVKNEVTEYSKSLGKVGQLRLIGIISRVLESHQENTALKWDGTKAKQYNYLPNGKLFSVKVYEYIFSDK